jgi:hypothetical protein
MSRGKLKSGVSTHVIHSKVKTRSSGNWFRASGTITQDLLWRRPIRFPIQSSSG